MGINERINGIIMKQKNYHSCTVGQIVAGNFDTTKVFSRYHIDFAAMAILRLQKPAGTVVLIPKQ